MTSQYRPDEFLPLSGIQHFLFCRRQWALIHVERQWQDNVLTAEGKLMHKRADDPFFTEARKGVVTARSVPVASYRLGLTGICDVVEFTLAEDGVRLPRREGLFKPAPVEYKRGRQKLDHSDEAQLCAQAVGLEEMLSTSIPIAFIFYGETRHRVTVELTEELRALVFKMAHEMHAYFRRGHTPKVKPTKACRSCSLSDLCLPRLSENQKSASQYIREHIQAE